MTWMSSNRLCHNPDKTQFILLGTSQQLAKRDVQHLATTQSPSDSVSNLGLLVDLEQTFRKHVTKLCQQSFFHLRRLRTVRDSLTPYSLTHTHSESSSTPSFAIDWITVMVRCLAQAHWY